MSATIVSRFGNDKQRQVLLPKVASGETFIAFAVTEPSGGTDILAMQSKATPDGKKVISSSMVKRYS